MAQQCRRRSLPISWSKREVHTQLEGGGTMALAPRDNRRVAFLNVDRFSTQWGWRHAGLLTELGPGGTRVREERGYRGEELDC